MSKKPLYPHVPKRKEPLYPHQREVPPRLRHVVLESGKTLSWDAWLRDLQGYQKRGETLPKVEYPQLKCKYCGAPVPEYVLKGKSGDVEIWASYHLKGHRDAVKELATKKLPWSAGLTPIAEAGIDQIIADLNLLREERVWIDTFKTTGASVIHIQTGDTATITSPPEDFTSPNYADRAMQIKWADGSEMVVDSNDFAPSSLQKQIAEITHGKPIPEFPTSEAAKEPWQMTREEFAEKYETARWQPEYIEARGKVDAIVDKTGKSSIELGREGNKEYLEAKAEMDAQLDIRNTPHVEHVRRALAEGKPVPPKVLVDYPELP